MALTPEDVVNKRFQPTKFREGYDQDEVDDFLDEIVVELRRLNQENDELRKKLAELGAGTPASSATAAPVVEKVPAPVKADKEKEDRAKAEAAAQAAERAKKKEAEQAPVQAAAPARTSAATPASESAAGLLAMAQQMHDKHVADGEQQRDKIIAEAQIEASSLVNDAQEKSRKILGALEQQRSGRAAARLRARLPFTPEGLHRRPAPRP
jgi:DivIVA domain-containing protein